MYEREREGQRERKRIDRTLGEGGERDRRLGEGWVWVEHSGGQGRHLREAEHLVIKIVPMTGSILQ